MTRYKFQEVSLTAHAKTADGKRRQKKFWQTLNPFNKNAQGLPKNREEILVELRAEADQWKQETLTSES